jgi:hypothetical protein
VVKDISECMEDPLYLIRRLALSVREEKLSYCICAVLKYSYLVASMSIAVDVKMKKLISR